MLTKMFVRTAVAVVIITVIVLATLPTPESSQSEAESVVDPQGIAFTDITVFDGERMLQQQTVLIEGATVAGIGADIAVPEGIEIIDGNGMTLLPGLIDAHVHTYGDALTDAPRFGVTTVLDMFTSTDSLVTMREGRESDQPTDRASLFSAGILGTVAGGHGTQYGVAVETLAGPDEAASWVATRKAEGSDFIKLVYDPYNGRTPSLDLATATALIESAHDADMMAVAHVTEYQAADDLIEAGIDGFVHVFIDKPADDTIVERAKSAGIFIIPTMTIMGVLNGEAPGLKWLDDPSIAPKLSPTQRNQLTQSFGKFPGIRAIENGAASVAAFHAAGVPILAGTDAPNPGTAHGVSLHDELAYLVRAGLSPTDALRAATSVPARHFNLVNRGRIRIGSRADLVLIEGDPSKDIEATRRIVTVFRNGQPLIAQPKVVETGASTPMPASLGDFEPGAAPLEGLLWTTTADTMMGGASTAELVDHSPGAGDSDGALGVVADARAGFPYPWAGLFLDASNIAPADISRFKQLRFDVRGTPARYRFMLFTTNAIGAPPTIEFDINNEWTTVTLELADAGIFDATKIVGLALVSPVSAGRYEFSVDNVQLMP